MSRDNDFCVCVVKQDNRHVFVFFIQFQEKRGNKFNKRWVQGTSKVGEDKTLTNKVYEGQYCY
jgi:hypothetical protein